MFACIQKTICWLALLLAVVSARADGWNLWGSVGIPAQTGSAFAQLATDGTNLYACTLFEGVWCASLTDQFFYPLPMTGFPLWDASDNTNGFAVDSIAATPQGTLVIAGSVVSVGFSNIVFNSSVALTNTLPVFYWWDGTNQLWHPATVTGKTYPYTADVGNFSIAPDGSLWTCSGFAGYVYHSTDGGHSYTAIFVNSNTPASYSPQPFSTNAFSTGKISSIMTGSNNEVVIGTETGGYLHTTNNGQLWTSLDPNFTKTNSMNPLGRIPDAVVLGFDAQGDCLCGGSDSFNSGFPGYAVWYGVSTIAWHPADGTCSAAANGLPSGAGIGPTSIYATPSGVSFMYMNQNYLLQGGVYRSSDGKNWTQFNDNIPGLTTPFANGLTNAVGKGNCITTLGNRVFVAEGNTIYYYDSTPLPIVTNSQPMVPPITNRPPVALPQNLTLWENTPTNFILAGYDADGDALNFTITGPPSLGVLGGTPPELTYAPTNNIVGMDSFFFQVDDGMATSAPVRVNVQIVGTGKLIPDVVLAGSPAQSWLLAGSTLTLAVTASDPNGINQVNFYNDTNKLAFVTKTPYVFTVTNLAVGNYVFNARAVDHQEGSAWAPPISVVVLPVAPQVSIQAADAADMAVSWPLALSGFYIETAPDPSGPWSLCPYPPSASTNIQTAIVPLGDQQFFRLMQP